VYEPEIGIDVTRACGDSIAMARVHGIRFVGVVVATVVDKDLKSLCGVRSLGEDDGLVYIRIRVRSYRMRSQHQPKPFRLRRTWCPCAGAAM
jgi:hypothetical protein